MAPVRRGTVKSVVIIVAVVLLLLSMFFFSSIPYFTFFSCPFPNSFVLHTTLSLELVSVAVVVFCREVGE